MISINRRISEFGRVFQLGFVPHDIPRALDHWINVMGVGPFFFSPHVKNMELLRHGKPIKLDFSVYISFWNDIQIELIEQHCDTPSIYSEWQARGSSGLHHACFLCDDIEEVRRSCADKGFAFMQEGRFGASPFAYFQTGGEDIQLCEVLQPESSLQDYFADLQAITSTWDGRDPIRSYA